MKELRLRQVREMLVGYDQVLPLAVPRDGWIKAVRQALGMSIRQLAERIGMSRTAVAGAEKSEARGVVQLETLKKLADGLECDLVYALVPRRSLDEILRRQARAKAEALVGSISESMELEAQGILAGERERQIAELESELLRERGRGFWDG